jgi:bacteriorhodopsin
MGGPYTFAAIIAVVILYVNTVSILKKVRKEQETIINTIIGCVCLIVILISIFFVCGR